MTYRSASEWPHAEGEMAARIRAFDWSKTPLGPIAAWSERCRGLVDMVLASGFPAIVMVGPDLIQVYNDAYRDLMGEKHPAGLGQPTRECWPEAWHVDRPIYERVFAGETVKLKDNHRVLMRRGTPENAWFTVSCSPLHDADGAVADILVVVFETTERVLADISRKKVEERQAFLLRLSDALRLIAEGDAIEWVACRLLAEHLDVDRAYYVDVDEAAGVARVEKDFARGGSPSLAGSHPVASFSWSVDILRRGECLVVSDTRVSPLVPDVDRPACAALAIVACTAVPLIKAGRLVGALCVTAAEPREWHRAEADLLSEVGERIWAAVEHAHTEKKLRESEERFRSFAENSTDTLWIFNAERQQLDYLNPAFDAMYGEDRDDVLADLGRFARLVHPEDAAHVDEAMPKLLAGATYQVEYRIVRPSDGTMRWIQDTGFPIRNADGRITRTGGIAQDVTDRREAEETLRDSEARLQVMVAELHHRTRNLVGLIGTIMRQMLGSGGSLADFRVGFTKRLEALSRVQSLLSRPDGERITVGDIVRLELDALGADLESARVRIEGEPVVLRRSLVQMLSLAVHELATNARKYGALVASEGWLAVRWQDYAGEDGRRRLRFEWTETGIDRVVEETVGPMHKGGYGRRLIEKALPYSLKAVTRYELGENRLDCTIDVPLDR